MNDKISNGTAIALAAAVTVGILALLALFCGACQDNETRKIERDIRAGTCPVRVATVCGDEVCKYTARVPCAELEELIKRNPRHDTE